MSISSSEGDWRDRYEWPTEETWVEGITRWVIELFLRAACTVETAGLERVPPTGSLIVAANHLLSFDAFFVGAFFPRWILFPARASAYRFRPVGWWLRMLGAFPIRRGQGDQWTLHRSLEILKQGKVLGWFPEGRVQHDTGLATAKTGVALVACRAGAPILPVAITGTELLSDWRRIGRGEINLTLTVGSLLEVEMVSEPSPELLRMITDELMHRIAGLLPLAYRGAYGP